MAIFDHSEFTPVFLGKLLEKIWNSHFWLFQIYTSLFGVNCWKKFRMAIFGHSKFIPFFLGKFVRKNSEWPFLAIPNLCQSFWKKLLDKIWHGQKWPFQMYISHFWKIVGKNLEQPFLVILNFF